MNTDSSNTDETIQPGSAGQLSQSIESYSKASQPLDDLLTSAARALRVERLYLLLPDAGNRVLASSGRGAPGRGSVCPPGPRDATAEVTYQGRVLARLVAVEPPTKLDPALLEPFAVSAGFLMGQTLELAATERALEQRRQIIDYTLQHGLAGEHESVLGELAAYVQLARRLLGADYAAAATLEPDGSTRWRAIDGSVTGSSTGTGVDNGSVLPPAQGHAARVIASGKPVILHGLGGSADLPAGKFPLHESEGGVSALGVPFIADGGHAYGALIVACREHHDWLDSDVELAELIARRASVLIQRMRTAIEERSNRIFLESVIQHMPGVFLVLRPPDFRIVRANNQLLNYLDVPEGESRTLVGLTLGELLDSGTIDGMAPELHSALQGVIETGKLYLADEFPIRSRAQGTSYWNWVAAPVDVAGAVDERLVLILAYEVTASVRAREEHEQIYGAATQQALELRRKQNVLEKIVEHYPGLLVVMEEPPDLRVVLANQQFTRLLPEPFRSGAPIEGRTSREITSDWNEQNDATLAVLSRVYETGEAVSFEQYETNDPDRGTTWWNWMVVPIGQRDSDEQRYLLLIANDVTDSVVARKDAQRAAAQARARADELEAVINQMADGVIIFDREGRMLRVNPMAEKLLGRGMASDAPPSSYADLYSIYTPDGERYPSEQLPAMLALKGETIVGSQMLVKRPAGGDVIISVSASPLYDAAGEITGTVAVFHDITQEKLVERLKDEFLSIVSHELRTPLTAIMGYSDLMLRGVHGAMTDRQGKTIRSVRANAVRLLHLINDLLDVSKLESGSVTLNPEALDIGEMVSRVITRTRVIASEAGVALINLVPQRPLARVYADETKVQQIIENLLTNAVKFTPEGGSVTFDAELSDCAADDVAVEDPEARAAAGKNTAQSVIVTVADTGTGLQEDQLERIWDRFYQVDTTAKRRTGGAGLGLAIVRNLVELHGGRVWVHSEGREKGSTFSFTLPLAEAGAMPAPLHQESPEEPRRITGLSDGSLGSVLVVEDHADQREIVCDMLETDGYKVILAEDGEEALDLATRMKPAAIILDVLLPRADGWEVLHRLKNNPESKDIPVLIISVVDQPSFGKKLGADEYLLKPLDPYALRSALRRMMKENSDGGSMP